jgi:acetyl-CoA carboxylase carboxyl transferase beta subunit
MLLLVLLSGTLLFQAILRKRDCLSFFSLNVNLEEWGFMIENTQEANPVTSLEIHAGERKSAHARLARELFVKCKQCRTLLYIRELEKNLKVCAACGYHFRLSARERVATLLDPASFHEADTEMKSCDPLSFIGLDRPYREKLQEEQKRTGLHEAVIIGTGSIGGHALALAVMDFHFIGGSMGSVVGEKITRAVELACRKRLPLLIISASGGARMQEGIFSLLQRKIWPKWWQQAWPKKSLRRKG